LPESQPTKYGANAARTGFLRAVQLGLAAWVALSIALPAGAAPEAQRTSDDRPNITVSGEGEVRAEPDMAIVTVGVTVVSASSQDAMDQVSQRLADVIASARALGVEARDIQTTGLSLQPISRPRPPPEPPEIEAYRASNNVSLTVRDIARAGMVLDAASRSGANVIGGLRFGLSTLDELRRQALANAVREAERKARAVATAGGVNITGVISIMEEGVAVPRPLAQADAVRAAPAEAVAPPVEPGELVIRARVRVSYSI
jgi:uncharacterized protein YggE